MVFENVKGGTTGQAGGGHRHCHCHPRKAGLSPSPVSFDCKWQKPSWTRQDKRGLAGLTNQTEGGRNVRGRTLECLPPPPKGPFPSGSTSDVEALGTRREGLEESTRWWNPLPPLFAILCKPTRWDPKSQVQNLSPKSSEPLQSISLPDRSPEGVVSPG